VVDSPTLRSNAGIFLDNEHTRGRIFALDHEPRGRTGKSAADDHEHHNRTPSPIERMDFGCAKRNCVPLMIFKNGAVGFPEWRSRRIDLVAENGMITAIRAQAAAIGETIVDLEGNYLAPGFIDLHVHGAMGRDTMQASTKAFRTICDYHASGGTTSLLLTTATRPSKHCQVVNEVRDAKSSIKQIAGVHVEGPFISKTKPVRNARV